ncbi:serine hydrolase domain-containing protein [Plantibacter sp. LMC-P-059a]|uniref:serine hydrolase domain-containing protein n=1 Tax=Plantibacter sp. LMC-P-059a TaxID=3040297 RepID=UPI00254C4313|nr:serine hydrolase domain-containing protein [Plantibacter sp. LMC-P-059a]
MTTTARRTSRSRRVWIIAAASTAVALAIGLAVRPGPSTLPTEATGDAELAATVRELAGSDHRALLAVVVTPDGTRTTTIGARPDTRFEIGSVSKAFTGLLLADAIERGEVTPDTTLGELLELGDAPAAEVTLEQLATHSSGLPRLPIDLSTILSSSWFALTTANPYGEDLDQLLEQARSASLDTPKGTYSNLGFELLGAALGAAAGTSYAELLEERITGPMGLDSTAPVADAAELGDRDLLGETAGGRTAAAWTGTAIGPAGGIRSDTEDLARFAERLADGSAPGIDALGPKAAFGDREIGWAWIVDREAIDGDDLVWHNGATGGFASFVGVVPATGTTVVLVSATQQSVDAAGVALLEQIGARR